MDIPFKGKSRSKNRTIPVCVTAPSVLLRSQAVLLTHGAGGDMNMSQLRAVAQAVAKAGYLCVRFTCKPPVLKHRLEAYRNVLVRIVSMIVCYTSISTQVYCSIYVSFMHV